MGLGLLTKQGRILKAELYKLANGASSPVAVQGLFWCAVGDGDGTFTNPLLPPAESAEQTDLAHEVIRKKFTTSEFLIEEASGVIVINGRIFNVSVNPTDKVLFEYLYDFTEANFTWKEYGIFGGNVVISDRYNGSQPPIASGIAGITIDFVSSLNGAGSGALTFTLSGTTLKWKAPGSSTFGPAINIGAGGNFQLTDGDDITKTIRVSVSAGSLPGSDTPVTPTLAAGGDIAGGGLNSGSNPQGQIESNGRLYFVRTINDQVKTSANQRPVRFVNEA